MEPESPVRVASDGLVVDPGFGEIKDEARMNLSWRSSLNFLVWPASWGMETTILRWLFAAAQRNWIARLHEVDARGKSESSLCVVSKALIAVRQSMRRSSGASEIEEVIE